MQAQLSAELRQNAELQQKVTGAELAAAEARQLVPSQSVLAEEEEARQRREREVRDLPAICPRPPRDLPSHPM